MPDAEGGTRTRTPCGATPSRWCVCQFHHFGEVDRVYFFSGVLGGAGVVAGAGAFCGAGGWDCFCCCCCLAPSRMTELPPDCLPIIIVSASEVSIKIIAAAVVALLSMVPAPRAPNVLWLPPPPKAPAQSAPLPCCRSTTRIRKLQ